MRRAIGPRGCDPILLALGETIHGPLPGKHAGFSFRRFHNPECSGRVALGLAEDFFAGITQNSPLEITFVVHCSMRSNAVMRFSKELAILNRKYPSPKFPERGPRQAGNPGLAQQCISQRVVISIP